MRSFNCCIHFPQAYEKFLFLDIFNFIVDVSSCDRRTNEKNQQAFFHL